mmetsp:Transcript_47069/g.108766  ORF Transcript_47069/g.108766 Transcript_47069/m.108766 type:complete len:389 (+) Transcript_47069:179-1345(+)
MASVSSTAPAEPTESADKSTGAKPGQRGGPLWIVVGGGQQGGILVRAGRSLNSEKLEGRLGTRAVVKEVDTEGDRLRYVLVSGDGPTTGWVTLRMKDRDLLVRQDGGQGPADTFSLSSVILWPRRSRRNQHLAPARPFRKVCIMGPYCCGTNALAKEFERFFPAVKHVNLHRRDFPGLWKHSIFTQMELPKDIFAVCLVRDPGYWVQSLGRGAAETPSTFNELEPVRVCKDKSGQLQVEYFAPKNASQLFRTVKFEGRIYQDALQIWEETVCTYLDKNIWPPDRTVVLRYEDFVFRFEDAMTTIAQRGGFPWKPDCGPIVAQEKTAKDSSHAKAARRPLSETKADMRNPDKRYQDRSEGEIKRMQSLPSAMTFGYNEDNAVAEWLVDT